MGPCRADRTGQGTRGGGQKSRWTGRHLPWQPSNHVAHRCLLEIGAHLFLEGGGRAAGNHQADENLCFFLLLNVWVFSLKTFYMVVTTRFPGKSNQNVPGSTWRRAAPLTPRGRPVAPPACSCGTETSAVGVGGPPASLPRGPRPQHPEVQLPTQPGAISVKGQEPRSVCVRRGCLCL